MNFRHHFWVLFVWECEDAEKGNRTATFLSKFSSIELVGTKGCVPIIDYKQIEKSTNNFHESNILGEGGFGCVYKAQLEDNLVVAVKKLHCQTQNAETEFEVINILSFIFCYFLLKCWDRIWDNFAERGGFVK